MIQCNYPWCTKKRRIGYWCSHHGRSIMTSDFHLWEDYERRSGDRKAAIIALNAIIAALNNDFEAAVFAVTNPKPL